MAFLWPCLQIYALYLVLIAIHEAGHHFAGTLLGYRWKGWIVGPLQVSRETGRVLVTLSQMPLSGRASAFHHPNDTRTRRAVRILGGPLASLLAGLAALAYFRHLPGDRQDAEWQVMAVLVMSGTLVLSSTIPYTQRGFRNDAALLVQLWRDREQWADYYAHRESRNLTWEAEEARYVALAALVASARKGQRPREWSRDLVERATVLRDGKANEAIAAHYAFYWAADRGDCEAAGEFLDSAFTLRETLSGAFRAMFLLDRAYYEGLIRRDGPAARMLLSVASGAAAPNARTKDMLWAMTLRAEAATLLADGNTNEALARAHEARSSLAFAGASGCSDRCLIECLIAACSAPTVQANGS